MAHQANKNQRSNQLTPQRLTAIGTILTGIAALLGDRPITFSLVAGIWLLVGGVFAIATLIR